MPATSTTVMPFHHGHLQAASSSVRSCSTPFASVPGQFGSLRELEAASAAM